MQIDQEFLVPDYYPGFRCKIGSCRHPCCNGWPVTVTLKDYFRLIGVNCSRELRRRLDGAFRVLPHPDEYAYAQICPGYDGTCPIWMEDGRCRIHAELGEDALAYVCRLFPRGVRVQNETECSCANSCEAVPEMFLHHPEPLEFIRMRLRFDLPVSKKPENIFADAGRGQDIRLYYIRIMQIRGLELPERLMTLGLAMQKIEKAVRAEDHETIDHLLTSAPEYYSHGIEKLSEEQLHEGLRIIGSMMEQVLERSESIKDRGEEVLKWFSEGDNSFERYEHAASNFESVVPNWRIVFEHLLVNHMFFEQFPFQDRPVPVSDEFPAICSVYTLLRFLSVGWTALHPAETEFVDVCAALFRFISHTAFDRFTAGILKQAGCMTPEKVYQLIRL